MAQANQQTNFVLCVDTVERGVSSGRFYDGMLTREYSFTGLDQFLLAVEALLDSGDAGLPYRECKSGAVWLSGKIATFKLQIRFRREGSWQGSAMWVETRHEELFRSELELLHIIRQALGPAQKQRMNPSSLKIAK